MNNGILAPQPFSVATDLVGIKPLLGVPQTVPTPYHLPKSNDYMIGNSDGFSSKDFVIVVDTIKGGSTTVSIPINISPAGGVIENIDWGDGSCGALIPANTAAGTIRRIGSFETRFEVSLGGAFTASHTYAKHGVYTIIIKGTIGFAGYVANVIPNAGNAATAILSYGRMNLLTLNHTSMPNLTYVPPYLEPGIPNPGGGVTSRSMANCFLGLSLPFKNVIDWDVSNVGSFVSAFQNTRINLDGNNWYWNTASGTSFNSMFNLATINNAQFNNWIFNGSTTLMFQATVNSCSFINWSGSNAISMFQGATLNNCTLSGWRITSAANSMFNGAGTNNLFVPNWDLRGVTNCSQMFNNSNGTKSGLDDWNVSDVTNMTTMFAFGSDFMTANLSNWDISKVTNFTQFMIRGFSLNTGGSASIRIDNWNIANGASCFGMFGDPYASKFVSLSGWRFLGGNNAANMFGNFNYSSALNSLNVNLSSWNTSGINNMSNMFSQIANASIGDISNWNTSNVTDMNNMFVFCGNFNSSVSGWNTSNVTNMSSMFQSANSFAGNGLSNWRPNKCINFSNMFLNGSLNVGISGWTIASGANLTSMFQSSAVNSGNFSNWTFSGNNINCTNMFNGCTNFRGIGLESWNTSGISSMNSMFSNASLFIGNGLNNWNVTRATTASSMFSNCSSLKVSLTGWNLCNCTNMTNFMIGTNIGSGNYDLLLNSWEATSTGNPIKPWATGINVHFGTVKYTAASSGARQRLVNYGWTITDGGLQA